MTEAHKCGRGPTMFTGWDQTEFVMGISGAYAELLILIWSCLPAVTSNQ